MSEREAFEEWVKKEHPHIYSGSLKDNEDSVRFKMDVDFMFSAWQASANREGYKFVPVEPTQEMLDKFPEVLYQDTYAGECSFLVDDETLRLGYKAMIGACDDL